MSYRTKRHLEINVPYFFNEEEVLWCLEKFFLIINFQKGGRVN